MYAYEAGIAGAEPCEQQAVEQLLELLKVPAEDADARIGEDGRFFAEQNARLVVNAEEYYRAMFHGGIKSRDLHMTHTLESLTQRGTTTSDLGRLGARGAAGDLPDRGLRSLRS